MSQPETQPPTPLCNAIEHRVKNNVTTVAHLTSVGRLALSKARELAAYSGRTVFTCCVLHLEKHPFLTALHFYACNWPLMAFAVVLTPSILYCLQRALISLLYRLRWQLVRWNSSVSSCRKSVVRSVLVSNKRSDFSNNFMLIAETIDDTHSPSHSYSIR